MGQRTCTPEEAYINNTSAEKALADVQSGKISMPTFTSVWDKLFGAEMPKGPVEMAKMDMNEVEARMAALARNNAAAGLYNHDMSTAARIQQDLELQMRQQLAQQMAQQKVLLGGSRVGKSNAYNQAHMNDTLRGGMGGPLHVNPPASAIDAINHAQEKNIRQGVILDTVSIRLRDGKRLIIRISAPESHSFEQLDQLPGALIEAVLVETDRGPPVDTVRMLIPQTPLDTADADKQEQERERRMHRLNETWPDTSVMVDDPIHAQEGDDEGV